MRSARAAKALWRCSVERHGFFRLRAPRRRPLLGALGALAGVTGVTAPTVVRTETQVLEDARKCRSSKRSFVRLVFFFVLLLWHNLGVLLNEEGQGFVSASFVYKNMCK